MKLLSFDIGLLASSIEDDFVASDDHFEELFVLQEQDVSRAANHRVQASLLDIEVDIKTVKHVEGDVSEHLVDHLDVATAS